METKIKLPSFWDEKYSPRLFTLLSLGHEKKNNLKELLTELMRAISPQKPTARELQQLSRIRRQTFLALFKAMNEEGALVRFGSGTRDDPYRYALAEQSSEALRT